MARDWEELKKRYGERIAAAPDAEELERIRIGLLGKKGEITALLQEMRDLSADEKRQFGMGVNSVKQYVEEQYGDKMEQLKARALERRLKNEQIDITLPGDGQPYGTLHPLTVVLNELEDIFVAMGYKVVEGPEVEEDLYNFEKANIPKDHPSRDMQDTLYIDVQRLMRTQTTAIQMRVLEAEGSQLPIKVVCPGKVYRKDDDDATHSHQFTQLEGLVVGKGITLADLKGTLELMARSMFGPQRQIRLRQSYFPFTEPSQEIDVSCHVCGGKGCPVCKGTGWIEMLGAGMVHPNVLRTAGIDPDEYSGFAFGAGLERVAMLKYGIDDIRDLYTNDIRFLQTYKRFE
jgi:phenylalanyl-tRNA synthetase alpha chain